jgi:hypothetical protein
MLPDLTIRVGKKAAAYVQERRRLLGLSANKHSNIQHEEKQSPRPKQRDEWDEAFF